MNAMILAAGRGERLRPYTDTCPKPLLEVNGKPLIDYHLQALAAAGIKQVVINVSWLAEKIKQQLGNGNQYGLEIIYSEESEALETAGGIVQALRHLEDRFIVVNADVFSDYSFEKLFDKQTSAHLVLVENREYHAEGDFNLRDGLVGNESQNRFTFAGIATYQKSFFDGLSSGRKALAPLLRTAAEKKKVSGEVYRGTWIDVGTPERWQQLSQLSI